MLTQYGADLDEEELFEIANDPLFTAFGLVRLQEGGAWPCQTALSSTKHAWTENRRKLARHLDLVGFRHFAPLAGCSRTEFVMSMLIRMDKVTRRNRHRSSPFRGASGRANAALRLMAWMCLPGTM